MSAIIFDGNKTANDLEQNLKKEVDLLRQQGKQIAIGAILFTEDAGSRLYTDLKQQAARRVGIEYKLAEFSLQDDLALVQKQIETWNQDQDITGIIIQKPWRKTWVKSRDTVLKLNQARQEFNNWWQQLVSKIDLNKDVDGLHPQTLELLKSGNYEYKNVLMPATARAVIMILEKACEALHPEQDLKQCLQNKKVLILGRSDIVGLPLFYVLNSMGLDVHLLGKTEIELRKNSDQKFLDTDVLISSTGVHHLVELEDIKPGAIVIDVGEPKADINIENDLSSLSFVTPVPGGVGPMTVSSLLQNSIILANLY